MEKSRKVIGVTLAVLMAVSAFFVGGYAATGNWNPWGNKHYYEDLNVNFNYCVSGSQNYCASVHNVVFNGAMGWLDQVMQGTTGTVTNGCFPSATCGMSWISLSATGSPAAGNTNWGSTNGKCGQDNTDTGTELSANGDARAAATTNTLLGYTTATGGTSVLVKTFTQTTTSQAIALACLNGLSASGATDIQFAAASFTSVTLQVSDTIQITWTLTWTWS